jgi:hypothetical protein
VTELRAVVIDWGGMLTQPIADTVRDWIAADQIDWDTYLAVVGPRLHRGGVRATAGRPPGANRRQTSASGRAAHPDLTDTARVVALVIGAP